LTAELTQEWDYLDAGKKAAQSADATTTTTTTTDNKVTSTTQDIELTIEPSITITRDDLLKLTKDIIAFYMAHNAEAEACDLLMEIEHVELLIDYTETETYQRVCLYLLG
jgi:hypothetical protein